MKLYLMSLGAGALVGIVYSLLNVRSPAPPVIALLGLLGMLVGEQVVPAVKRIINGEPVTITWFRNECVPRITGAPAAPAAPANTVEAAGPAGAADPAKSET
ncbi:XapX domain-containing protein [Noviherbaspirillum malthae]|uniref:XapX domain-containing protein n=1 Tax=Noviherbaspirillum malthae TaxID=1260987 RepID=UPI00188FF15C|nr:XapX domain-containing protein [Noviherbaspirillum malthae]